ncbi:mediator complex subunit Med15 [Branchiostoma belcheri]|nr:mediator complex subunit Med15 [Branchiostoma belcheri]
MEQIQESTAGVAGSASPPANNNSPLARVSSWPPNFTGPTGPHSTGKGTLQGLARCDPRCLVEASRGDRHALPPHCLREARRALPSGGSIDDAVRAAGNPTSKSSMEMENHVFQKAKSREEYLALVARLILHVRDSQTKKDQQRQGGGPQQDPMNALQNLTSLSQGQPSQQAMQMSQPSQLALQSQLAHRHFSSLSSPSRLPSSLFPHSRHNLEARLEWLPQCNSSSSKRSPHSGPAGMSTPPIAVVAGRNPLSTTAVTPLHLGLRPL